MLGHYRYYCVGFGYIIYVRRANSHTHNILQIDNI